MRSVATGSLSFVRITLRRPGSTLFPYTTLFRSLPSLIRSDIPPDLESICLKCLAKEPGQRYPRSEEHTSELQSLRHLVCRLLLEKKKNSAEGGNVGRNERRQSSPRYAQPSTMTA